MHLIKRDQVLQGLSSGGSSFSLEEPASHPNPALAPQDT